MKDTIRIVVHVQTNLIKSRTEATIEIPRDEWEDMDDDERDDYLKDEMFNMIEWGYYEEDENQC